MLGIYGNSKEEALYPAYYVDAGGAKLDGSKPIHAALCPGQLPPVNAFWSLTMYELPASLLVANPIKRYLINSPMLPDLQKTPTEASRCTCSTNRLARTRSRTGCQRRRVRSGP